jgi:histone H3/H4
MPEGRQDFSRIFGEIKQEFFRFADSYAEAVSSGVQDAGEQMIKSGMDFAQHRKEKAKKQ